MNKLIVRELDQQEYKYILNRMIEFTDNRSAETADEIWILQHNSVFTQGKAGNDSFIITPGDIPVIRADRGGHVTYHGPGQITAYILIDLKRAEMSVFELISVIEKTVINTMSKWKVHGYTDRSARGVYCKSSKKIASVGLRVRRNCTYHGISFNVDMDMSPWKSINACGLDLEMTQLKNETNDYVNFSDVLFTFKKELIKELGYNNEIANIVDSTSL